MDKDVLSYVVEKTNELINAATCNSETKAAAEAWLAAVGTDREAEATETYVKELDAGAQVFGADHAPVVAAHAKEIKAAGAKYCDCPACAAVEAILNKKESILK